MTLSGDPQKTLLSWWMCFLFSYNLELHVFYGSWWNTETPRSLHPLRRCIHQAVCSCVFHLELSNFPLNVYLFAKDSCGGKFCNCIILFPYRCCRLRLIFTPWLGSVLTSQWLQGVLCSPENRLYCLTCARVLTERKHQFLKLFSFCSIDVTVLPCRPVSLALTWSAPSTMEILRG